MNWLKAEQMKAVPYLEPLPVRLHLQHHAWVGLGEGVPVGDSPAGHPQLHFGQAWRADEAQRGLRRLVDVAHAERTLGGSEIGEGWGGVKGVATQGSQINWEHAPCAATHLMRHSHSLGQMQWP